MMHHDQHTGSARGSLWYVSCAVAVTAAVCVALVSAAYLGYRSDDPWEHVYVSRGFSEARFRRIRAGMREADVIRLVGHGLPPRLWRSRADFGLPANQVRVFVAPNTRNYDIPFVWRYVELTRDRRVSCAAGTANDVGFLDWVEGWLEDRGL